MTNLQRAKAASYGDIVIQQFRSLRDKDELCDFQVSAEGRTFKVCFHGFKVVIFKNSTFQGKWPYLLPVFCLSRPECGNSFNSVLV
jgi:hypothetical protein